MEPGVVLHLDDVAVAARGHQAQERRFQLGVGQVEGRNVAPQVMDRHQGFAGRVGQPLGKVDPHQHRPDQARGKGDRHRVHLVDGAAGVGQGLVHRGTDVFTVPPAGNFGHHAAIESLFLDTGGDDVAFQHPAVLDQGGRRLVTGGFDSQYNHCSRLFLRCIVSGLPARICPGGHRFPGGLQTGRSPPSLLSKSGPRCRPRPREPPQSIRRGR